GDRYGPFVAEAEGHVRAELLHRPLPVLHVVALHEIEPRHETVGHGSALQHGDEHVRHRGGAWKAHRAERLRHQHAEGGGGVVLRRRKEDRAARVPLREDQADPERDERGREDVEREEAAPRAHDAHEVLPVPSRERHAHWFTASTAITIADAAATTPMRSRIVPQGFRSGFEGIRTWSPGRSAPTSSAATGRPVRDRVTRVRLWWARDVVPPAAFT